MLVESWNIINHNTVKEWIVFLEVEQTHEQSVLRYIIGLSKLDVHLAKSFTNLCDLQKNFLILSMQVGFYQLSEKGKSFLIGDGSNIEV